MTTYVDYLKQQRPSCWGRASAYDGDDDECRGCRFEHSCRSKIQAEERVGGGPARSIPVRGYEKTRGKETDVGEPVEYNGNFIEKRNAEIVPEGQSPWERFVKDGATGALRGMFGEFYSFFRHYRIP